jgi:hypothetical protein
MNSCLGTGTYISETTGITINSDNTDNASITDVTRFINKLATQSSVKRRSFLNTAPQPSVVRTFGEQDRSLNQQD